MGMTTTTVAAHARVLKTAWNMVTGMIGTTLALSMPQCLQLYALPCLLYHCASCVITLVGQRGVKALPDFLPVPGQPASCLHLLGPGVLCWCMPDTSSGMVRATQTSALSSRLARLHVANQRTCGPHSKLGEGEGSGPLALGPT